MIPIPVTYSNHLKLYMGFSYNIFASQYKAMNPQQSYGDDWDLWERLWDDVLAILSYELERQNCMILSYKHIDPISLEEIPPKTMLRDLHGCWMVMAHPPTFDAQTLLDALAKYGLENGLIYLRYENEYEKIVTVVGS